jgi:hypothetical protein
METHSSGRKHSKQNRRVKKLISAIKRLQNDETERILEQVAVRLSGDAVQKVYELLRHRGGWPHC